MHVNMQVKGFVQRKTLFQNDFGECCKSTAFSLVPLFQLEYYNGTIIVINIILRLRQRVNIVSRLRIPHLGSRNSYVSSRTSHLVRRTELLAPRTLYLAPRTSYLAPRTSHLVPSISYIAPRTVSIASYPLVPLTLFQYLENTPLTDVADTNNKKQCKMYNNCTYHFRIKVY